MASSKNWALYATNLRLGTFREHRMAGARLGKVGCSVEFSLPNGWRFSVYVGRTHLAFTRGEPNGSARMQEFLDYVMGPSVRKNLTQSRKDIDEGRGYRFDPKADGRDIPLATWKPDDPQQPPGWHHDGKHWVLNKEGWKKDRYGYWRYTEPGDVGWVEHDHEWVYYTAPGVARPVPD
jgi:hypothetical protein